MQCVLHYFIGNSDSSSTHLHRRNSEERLRIVKLLTLHVASNGNDTPSAEKPAIQEELPRRSRGRSNSPHRASITKSPKSAPPTKPMNSVLKNHCQGTPANHTTSLPLKEIMCICPEDNVAESSKPFLSTLDNLCTLSDLVLAIPACGAAIHRFKPAKDFKIHNVISGCLDPPQTAISYLLHKLLPQPRPAPKQESEGTQITDNAKSHKMSQAAARLMSKCTSIHIFDCQLYDNLI